MRKTLVFGTVAAAVVGLGMTAVPAQACSVSTSTACTTVAALAPVGALTIATTGVGIGNFTNVIPSGAQSITADADLMLTTVTDTRLGGTAWTVTANMTDFAPPLGGTAISKTQARLSVPAPSKVLGAAGMVITSQASAVAPDSASGDIASFVAATGTGGLNTVTYTPHIQVIFPAGTVAGTYTGTLTQSVS